jgi:hypothetical protein
MVFFKKILNWKGSGRKQAMPNLGYCTVFCFEGLRKATKGLKPGQMIHDPRFESGTSQT